MYVVNKPGLRWLKERKSRGLLDPVALVETDGPQTVVNSTRAANSGNRFQSPILVGGTANAKSVGNLSGNLAGVILRNV